MCKNVDKIRNAFILLGLSITEVFLENLWFDKSVYLRINKEIKCVIDNLFKNGYYTDFYPKLCNMKIEKSDFIYLLNWIDHVFINGTERSDEFLWSNLLGQAVNKKTPITNAEIKIIVKNIVDLNRTMNQLLRKNWKQNIPNLDNNEISMIKTVINEIGDKGEDTIEYVEDIFLNIGCYNNFVHSFYTECKDLSFDKLKQLFEWAKENAAIIEIAKIQVCYPRSWEINYLNFEEFWKN